MPVIHVEMWQGRSVAQKKEIVKAITDAFERIVNTPPDSTIVIFNDIPKDSWAQSGVLSSET